MGKNGRLIFEKRALNIWRRVRLHSTHPLKYAAVDHITSEYRRSHILCTIKKPPTCNRKSATESILLRYFSLEVSIDRV